MAPQVGKHTFHRGSEYDEICPEIYPPGIGMLALLASSAFARLPLRD